MKQQIHRTHPGNVKQLKKEIMQQKARDAQLMAHLRAVDKSLKQMTAYLGKLAAYVDARTEKSEAAILQAVGELDKKAGRTEAQNREILKLLLSTLKDSTPDAGKEKA